MQPFFPAISNKYGYSGQTNRANRNNLMAAPYSPTLKGPAANDVFFRGGEEQSPLVKRKAHNRAMKKAFKAQREKELERKLAEKMTELAQKMETLTETQAATLAENQNLKEQLTDMSALLVTAQAVLPYRQEASAKGPTFQTFRTADASKGYLSPGLENHPSPDEPKLLPETEATNPWAKK